MVTNRTEIIRAFLVTLAIASTTIVAAFYPSHLEKVIPLNVAVVSGYFGLAQAVEKR